MAEKKISSETESKPKPKSKAKTPEKRHEFVFSRVVDAPRALVFSAYTDAELLKHWWGPKGFTMSSALVDLRPGGFFHYGMRSPDGKEMWGKWVFQKIAPPESLDFIVSFSDEKGNSVPHPFAPEWPVELLVKMTFTEQEGKTIITGHSIPVNASDSEFKVFEAGFKSMEEGYKGTLDQLDGYLAKEKNKIEHKATCAVTRPGKKNVDITRMINAPLDRVFEAWTDPKHMAQWWGPKGFRNPVCELDVRPGGKYRIVMLGPDGVHYPMAGEFKEVGKLERLVFTSTAKDEDGKALLEGVTTVTFSKEANQTKLTLHSGAVGLVEYAGPMLEGMEEGWTQSMERLDDHIKHWNEPAH